MNTKPCKALCCNEYLSDLSPRDKPWDTHKAQSGKVRDLYKGTIYDRLAGHIGGCSGQIEFGWTVDTQTGEKGYKLKSAFFCRNRHCPICQWRRSLVWRARLFTALPSILRDYPSSRFLFLTLTVPNCKLSDLRSTIDWMNQSWKRMTHRKNFPAIGFVRSTEVRRRKHDLAGPHFHALLMVPESYFQGKYYLSQEKWTDLWQSCLKVSYTPIVNIKAVKPNKKWLAANPELTPVEAITGAIVETVKYSIKPEDLIGAGTADDQQWLLQLTKQLQNTRAIALGGVFKKYISESEPEKLEGEDSSDEDVSAESILFGWREKSERYVKTWED